MPTPQPDLTIREFAGVDYYNDPRTLPLSKTNKAKNVYGGVNFVRKRPGTTPFPISWTGTNEPRDLHSMCEYKAVRNWEGVIPQEIGRHILVLFFSRAHPLVYTDEWGYYDLRNGTFTDKGAISPGVSIPTGGYGVGAEATTREFGVADDAGYVASTLAWVKLDTANLPEYTLASLPAWAAGMAHLAWFKGILFAGPFAGSKVSFSLALHPEVQRSTDDEWETDTSGSIKMLTGLKAVRDVLYQFSADQIEAITGTTFDQLDRVCIASGFGGCAQEGWADVYGTLVGFGTRRGTQAETDVIEAVAPDDILFISGRTVKKIGLEIRPKLVTYPAAVDRRQRATFWPGRDLALLAPYVYYAGGPAAPSDNPGDTDVFAYDVKGGGFWPWSYGVDGSMVSMVTAPARVNGVDDMRVIFGMRRGPGSLLRYLDETAATDSGVPFESFWETTWLDYGKQHEAKVEEIFIKGNQVSGGEVIISVATERDDSTMKQVGTVDLEKGGGLIEGVSDIMANLGMQVSSRWYKVRVDFAPDGVMQEINELTLTRKGQGRPKEWTS